MMKPKPILMGALVFMLTICCAMTSFATQIYVDLEEVNTDVPPQIINDRTMVPVRAIAEMVGCRVEWKADKKQVEIYDPKSNALMIVMQIGNKVANYAKYGEEQKDRVETKCEMDSPPVIIHDRTFVPLRFISEALDYTVDYNVDNGNVYLFSPAYILHQIGEGKGTDDGEGMGAAIPISNSEISYVLSFKTKSWSELTDAQKDHVVMLIARWWEVVDGYVVPDFDALRQDLDHQMATYFRNDVNISVFETACDIRDINTDKYLKAKG